MGDDEKTLPEVASIFNPRPLSAGHGAFDPSDIPLDDKRLKKRGVVAVPFPEMAVTSVSGTGPGDPSPMEPVALTIS